MIRHRCATDPGLSSPWGYLLSCAIYAGNWRSLLARTEYNNPMVVLGPCYLPLPPFPQPRGAKKSSLYISCPDWSESFTFHGSSAQLAVAVSGCPYTMTTVLTDCVRRLYKSGCKAPSHARTSPTESLGSWHLLPCQM